MWVCFISPSPIEWVDLGSWIWKRHFFRSTLVTTVSWKLDTWMFVGRAEWRGASPTILRKIPGGGKICVITWSDQEIWIGIFLLHFFCVNHDQTNLVTGDLMMIYPMMHPVISLASLGSIRTRSSTSLGLVRRWIDCFRRGLIEGYIVAKRAILSMF